MSSIFSELGGITAGTAAEGLAFAAGFAASRALEPAAITISQDAWTAAPVRRLPPEIAAEAAAENYSSYDTMAAEATYSGWDGTRFAYLYDVTLTAPGMGELIAMLRRGTINGGNFTHGLRKAKIEPMWDSALTELQTQRISATDLAYMMVRGVVPDDGLLGMSLPTSADKLQLPPQYPIDPVQQAADTGWTKEQLGAMVARSGLAMAPVMAAQANFRGILSDNDYLLTIARGDLFPAYADPVREASREILTADQAMEGVLRGWWDMQTGFNLAAMHGMTQANAQRLYEIRRRPMTVANITKALARGGTFDASQAPFADPYVSSVHEADLGPEWYDLQEHLKYSYPSAFVIRALLKDGAIGAAEASQIFQYEGYPPSLADLIANHYAAGSGVAADPHIAKAQTQLWTTTHTAYKNAEIDSTEAQANMTTLGITPAAQTEVMTYWNAERDTFRKQLTPAQIKKAWSGAVVNPATGVAWTLDDALAALIARGYSPNDAHTFLNL